MIGIAGISSAQGEVQVHERVTPRLTATAEPPSQPVADRNHQASPKLLYKKFLTAQAFFAAVAGATVEQPHDWPGANEGGPGLASRSAPLHFTATLSSVPLAEDGVKVIHRDDTRYRRPGRGNRFKRTGHAVTASWVAHRPDAGRTPPTGSRPRRVEVGRAPHLWSPASC